MAGIGGTGVVTAAQIYLSATAADTVEESLKWD